MREGEREGRREGGVQWAMPTGFLLTPVLPCLLSVLGHLDVLPHCIATEEANLLSVALTHNRRTCPSLAKS